MTYGQHVKRIKKSLAKMPVPMQLWVAETVLKELMGADSSDLLKVNGRFIHDSDAYKDGMAKWNAELKRLGL